ncbi:MAG TPA: hypothetical protein VK711_07470 [Puia sp.]|nr:hypothetical protein [Puia sp.]
MKKIAFIIIVCWLITACRKNNLTPPGMEGKWQLSSIFIQTTGTGSWHTEDSIPPDFIQFNHDGTLSMSPYVSTLYNGPVTYQVKNDSIMIFNYPNGANALYGDNIIHFHFTDSVLTLTPPSMELVIEKYIKVQ